MCIQLVFNQLLQVFSTYLRHSSPADIVGKYKGPKINEMNNDKIGEDTREGGWYRIKLVSKEC